MIPASFVKTVTPKDVYGERFERVRYRHPLGFTFEYLIRATATADERFNYDYTVDMAIRMLPKQYH